MKPDSGLQKLTENIAKKGGVNTGYVYAGYQDPELASGRAVNELEWWRRRKFSAFHKIIIALVIFPLALLLGLVGCAWIYKSNEMYDYPSPKFPARCNQSQYARVAEVMTEDEFFKVIKNCFDATTSLADAQKLFMDENFGCSDIEDHVMTCSVLRFKTGKNTFRSFAFRLSGNPIQKIEVKKEQGFALWRNCGDKCHQAYCICIGNEHNTIRWNN